MTALMPCGLLADEWRGHGATLKDAQIACRDIDSKSCEPYAAEAVAVVDVLSAQAKPLTSKDRPLEFSVVFHTGHEEHCSAQWLRSLSGQSLLHTALGLDRDAGPSPFLWSEALLRAARLLCHA
jgi:hypothetical protein